MAKAASSMDGQHALLPCGERPSQTSVTTKPRPVEGKHTPISG
jgi:hypothetical protein